MDPPDRAFWMTFSKASKQTSAFPNELQIVAGLDCRLLGLLGNFRLEIEGLLVVI